MLVQCTGYDDSVAFTGHAPIMLNCAAQNGVASIPRVDDTSPLYTDALSSAQTGTIGGFLKIELQDTNKVWRDVTMEILNYGIGAPNLDGTACADPSPNAILRIQRLRDNGGQTRRGQHQWRRLQLRRQHQCVRLLAECPVRSARGASARRGARRLERDPRRRDVLHRPRRRESVEVVQGHGARSMAEPA